MTASESSAGARMWVTVAVLGLAAALGYSLGIDRHQKVPVEQPHFEIPLDANALYQLKVAGVRAREAGDSAAAEWFDTVINIQKDRLVKWRPAGAKDGESARCPAAPSPFASIRE